MNTKGHCYPKYSTLQAVYFKLRFTLSYQDIAEIMKKHGVQVRGGWSCASTFAHSLFDVSAEDSKAIIKKILGKYFSQKSGWVYRSLHSTTSDEDILFICGAV